MKFISISDQAGPETNFLAPYTTDSNIQWESHSGLKRKGLESIVPSPHLGRLRAAIAGARSARDQKGSVLVSHLPYMTFAAAKAQRFFGRPGPHVAFSFNFTDLPTGPRKLLFSQEFRKLTELVVYSRLEVDLYSEYFGIERDRMRFVPWTMGRPEADKSYKLPVQSDYFCAVGSEAREYGTLMNVMRSMPKQKLVLVTRPRAMLNVDVPDNVLVLMDIPAPHVWAIVRGSKGLVVPLRNDDTPNGHVTIVGTQMHGIPLIASDSKGIADYVDDDRAWLFESGNAEALRHLMEKVIAEPELASRKAAYSQSKAMDENNVKIWVDYFAELKNRL